MTRNRLEELYAKAHRHPGDTDYDFYEWAIDYLIKIYNLSKKG